MDAVIHIKDEHTPKLKKTMPKGFGRNKFKVPTIFISQKTDEAVPASKNHANYMM